MGALIGDAAPLASLIVFDDPGDSIVGADIGVTAGRWSLIDHDPPAARGEPTLMGVRRAGRLAGRTGVNVAAVRRPAGILLPQNLDSDLGHSHGRRRGRASDHTRNVGDVDVCRAELWHQERIAWTKTLSVGVLCGYFVHNYFPNLYILEGDNMGVVWMEGFELFGNLANLKKKYRGQLTDDLVIETGRTGGSCVRLPATGSRFTSELFEPQTSMTIGFGIKASSVAETTDFLDFRHDTDRIFTVGMHSQGTLTFSSEYLSRTQCDVAPWASDQWHYLEIKFSTGPGNGRVQIRLDQTTIFDQSDLQLTPTSWNDYEQLKINNIAWYCDITSISLDDIYLCDNLGHDNYDFLGPCKIQGLLPISNGSSQQWVDPLGGNHYTQINDLTPDDDATYLRADDAGLVETFNFPEPTMYGTRIAATSVEFLGEKETAGLAAVAPAVRQNNIIYVGKDQYVNDNYRYHWQCYDHDPATGKAWTLLGLYDAEFGIKRTY